MITGARNCQRLSKRGKDRGDPKLPRPGVSPVPRRASRGCAEPTSKRGMRRGAVVLNTLFKNSQGTTISRPRRGGPVAPAQRPAAFPRRDAPVGSDWPGAEPRPTGTSCVSPSTWTEVAWQVGSWRDIRSDAAGWGTTIEDEEEEG